MTANPHQSAYETQLGPDWAREDTDWLVEQYEAEQERVQRLAQHRASRPTERRTT